MQLWFARDADVPLRQQLVTQVILGIVCDELRPGQRLPSTRELARRFHIHPNTISSAYRQLQREGWLDLRKGSGVYVRTTKPEAPLSPAMTVDRLIGQLALSARSSGIKGPLVRQRLKLWLKLKPPDHVLLVERDVELRRILLSEIQAESVLSVEGHDITALTLKRLKGAIVITLPQWSAEVTQGIPAGTELITLRLNSVPAALLKWLPAPKTALLGVASRWPQFLKMANTMLIAAGFDPDTLLFRDTRKRGWRRGLNEAAAVVCDSLTAEGLPQGLRAIPFQLVSDASREEVRRCCGVGHQTLLPTL
jgi:DNA-binding transcriptional regulator YhcF (GntR family)